MVRKLKSKSLRQAVVPAGLIDAYDLVFRHARDIDESGDGLAFDDGLALDRRKRRELLADVVVESAAKTPPQSGWLDGLGRLKGGRWLYLGVARCAPLFTAQRRLRRLAGLNKM